MDVGGEVVDSVAAPLTALLTAPVGDGCPAVAAADALKESGGPEMETPNPLRESELGVVCPPLAAEVLERRRPDSNRGWWICNPSADCQNVHADQDFGEEAGDAYRSAYRADWEREEIVDRRVAFDETLARIVEAWPGLTWDDQRGIAHLVERLG